MAEHFYSADTRAIPTQRCPWCGYRLNTIGQAQSQVCELPEPGDTTVCLRCMEVSVFVEGGQLRQAGPEDIDDTIRAIQADIRRLSTRFHGGG